MTNTRFPYNFTTWHRSRREWAALPAQTSISALRLVLVTPLLCITTWLHFRVQKCLDVLCSNVYMSYSCIVESLLLEALSFLNIAALALDLQCTIATPHGISSENHAYPILHVKVYQRNEIGTFHLLVPLYPRGKR